MSDKAEESTANSLGLNFETLKVEDTEVSASDSKDAPAPSSTEPEGPIADSQPDEEAVQNNDTSEDAAAPEDTKSTSPPVANTKEKKKQPYANPDRVKTGGAQRDKLSEEELVERMVRIREQNEKIKLRREDVKKDEDEFRKTQEAERVKQSKNRKVQENVNHAREQNARRKMEKIQSREWDTGKPGVKPAESRLNNANGDNSSPASPNAKIGIRGVTRGGGRGNSTRGRGRGAPLNTVPREEKPQTSEPVPAAGPESPPKAATAASS